MQQLARVAAWSSTVALTFAAFVQNAAAAMNLGNMPNIGGSNDIQSAITNVIVKILTFLALLAVILIVIAGIRLMISQGEEAEKDKAKKTILYVFIGLVVILIARAIVQIFIDIAAQ